MFENDHMPYGALHIYTNPAKCKAQLIIQGTIALLVRIHLTTTITTGFNTFGLAVTLN